MEISRRHHLRNDEVRDLVTTIENSFGATLTGDAFEAVSFANEDRELILIDGEPAVFNFDDGPVLTVRGANAVDPTRNIVTVDAGAVQFVSNGADIMRPGIVAADEEIDAGDYVLIAEETHGKILAVGIAKTSGSDMLGDSGNVIDTIHHVGDDWYGFVP